MILPQSDTPLYVLMILCLLCWGSWPVLFKFTKKYRFELFYFDFAIGLGVVALICALTFGSLGFDGFNFTDDLMSARKSEWLIAMLAAMIFNFGNMLMLAAISVCGMAVAVPLAFGAAMVIGSWMSFFGSPATNLMALTCGTVLMAVSIVLNSAAYSHLRVLQHEALARAGKAKTTRRPNSTKGILLALIGGVVMGTFGPLLLRAQDPQDGVGPYALLFLFAVAIGLSTFIFNLFFMNLPVEGDPVEITDYFKTPITNHFFGFLAGGLWGVGALASFVAGTPKGIIHPAGVLPMLGYAAPIVAALWGWLMWKENKGGDSRVKAFGALMLVLFAGGWGLLSLAVVSTLKP